VNGAAILLTLPAVVAVGAILFVGEAVVVSVRRGRRSVERERAGLCVRCGYDVRQSTDRCPECGLPILRRRHPVTGEFLD
jgi:hypothetical protein